MNRILGVGKFRFFACVIPKVKHLFTLCVFALMLINLQAQDCFDYHVYECKTNNEGFKLSSQSKSALFKLGHSSSFTFKAMQDYEYIVTLCYDKNLEGISLTVSDQHKDKSYSIERGDRFVNLVVEETTDFLVKVDVPLGDVDIESVLYDDLYGCVGIRIEYRRFKDE